MFHGEEFVDQNKFTYTYGRTDAATGYGRIAGDFAVDNNGRNSRKLRKGIISLSKRRQQVPPER